MLPLSNEAVTLIKRSETKTDGKTTVSYTTHHLQGCSWRRTRRWQREAEAIVPYEGITCRVPAGQTAPHVGDLMILGTVSETVTTYAQYQALVEKYTGDGAFVVASVSDNARPGLPLPHWAVRS